MRRLSLSAVAVAVTIGLAACGSSDNSSDSTSGGGGGGGGDGAKIGLALSGTKNDHGFYQLEYEGFQKAQAQLKFQGTTIDSLATPQAILTAMKNLSQDNKLVIGGGAEFIDAAKTLSPQFPDVQYAIITGVVPKGLKNVHGYQIRQGLPAYIGGAAAAVASKVQHLGFIGGLEIPPTVAALDGFKAGAKSQKPNIEVSSTVVGSFSDPAKAKEAASAQVASGADQIFSFLDAGTAGVEQAITASGKDVGVQNPDGQRCDVFDGSFGATVLGMDVVMEHVVRDFQAGKMPDGTKTWGVEDPAVLKFELCPKYAKDSQLSDVVKSVTEKLAKDEIKLPSTI